MMYTICTQTIYMLNRYYNKQKTQAIGNISLSIYNNKYVHARSSQVLLNGIDIGILQRHLKASY